MEQWQQEIYACFEMSSDESIIQATISNLQRNSDNVANRIIVRPLFIRGELNIQFEHHYPNKVRHENLAIDEAGPYMVKLIKQHYRQVLIKTAAADIQLLFTKSGKATMLKKPPTAQGKDTTLTHNRTKHRILDGEDVPTFLIELGIMAQNGQVYANKQDKYKQINRFLEMVSDVMDALPQDTLERPLKIVDFGCGKSYLTFALYHLLVNKQRRHVEIVGLDLKADVIEFCKKLADRLNYAGLHFQQGDIKDFTGTEHADMVVTLHACDTATDAALAKAVEWGAHVVMSVPCCQHELFKQLSNPVLKPLLKHGLLRDEFTALVTDSLRGQLLETVGYKVQMLEFIAPEHTPKNTMIRAVRKTSARDDRVERERWNEYVAMRDQLNVHPSLEAMLRATSKLKY